MKEAVKCGVKVAFENTEGEEYLDAVRKACPAMTMSVLLGYRA